MGLNSRKIISGTLVSIFISLTVLIPLAAVAQVSGTIDECAINAESRANAIRLQIPIPGITHDEIVNGETVHYVKNLSCYIAGVYRYFASIAGIMATIMMMYGGLKYVVSFGSADKMAQAKDTIVSALIGLVLVLSSFLILFVINPNLTTLEPPSGLRTIETISDQWCEDLERNGVAVTPKQQDDTGCGAFGTFIDDKGTPFDSDDVTGECAYQGECPVGEICWTIGRGRECYQYKTVCEDIAKGWDACKAVDIAMAAAGIEDKVCVPDNPKNEGDEDCDISNRITCADKKGDDWEQVPCYYPYENEQSVERGSECWSIYQGQSQPSHQKHLYCSSEVRIGEGKESICCAKKEYYCRSKRTGEQSHCLQESEVDAALCGGCQSWERCCRDLDLVQ